MTIGELRAAMAALPDDMPVMLLGERRIAERQSGDAGDAGVNQCEGPSAVIWLIGEEWRALQTSV